MANLYKACDQMDYAISNVTVSSTGESEEDLPVENLTDQISYERFKDHY